MNKKILIIGFAVVFVIILILVIVNLDFFSAKKEALSAPQIEAVRDDEDIIFNLTTQFNAVEKASVYEYSSINVIPQRLAQLWNFSKQPEVENAVYIWDTLERQLYIDLNSLSIRLSRDLIVSPLTSSGPALDSVDAFQVLQQYLESKDLWNSLFKLNPACTAFHKTGATLANEAGQQSANITEIGVDAYIDGKIIYNRANPLQPRIKAWISTDNEIVKLDYYLLGDVGDTVGSYPLKTLGELQQDVNAGKAKLAGLEGSRQVNFTENIVRANISSVNLSYLQPQEDEKVLQPVYVFRGPAEFTSGATSPAIFYLPAVSSELLK